MSFCRSLRTIDCNLLWARCFSFQSQRHSVRQQLFLILNLKLNFKTAIFPHKYLPLLIFTYSSSLKLLSPSLTLYLSYFNCDQLWENKVYWAVKYYRLYWTHQSPSTKKPHKRKKFVSLQVGISKEKLKWGNGLQNPEGSQRVQNRFLRCLGNSSTSQSTSHLFLRFQSKRHPIHLYRKQ